MRDKTCGLSDNGKGRATRSPARSDGFVATPKDVCAIRSQAEYGANLRHMGRGIGTARLDIQPQ